MPPSLIDTNLLVYLYDQNQPGKQASPIVCLSNWG
jgi:hypothetical protein